LFCNRKWTKTFNSDKQKIKIKCIQKKMHTKKNCSQWGSNSCKSPGNTVAYHWSIELILVRKLVDYLSKAKRHQHYDKHLYKFITMMSMMINWEKPYYFWERVSSVEGWTSHSGNAMQVQGAFIIYHTKCQKKGPFEGILGAFLVFFVWNVAGPLWSQSAPGEQGWSGHFFFRISINHISFINATWKKIPLYWETYFSFSYKNFSQNAIFWNNLHNPHCKAQRSFCK
jgi:hypothetical protein